MYNSFVLLCLNQLQQQGQKETQTLRLMKEMGFKKYLQGLLCGLGRWKIIKYVDLFTYVCVDLSVRSKVLSCDQDFFFREILYPLLFFFFLAHYFFKVDSWHWDSSSWARDDRNLPVNEHRTLLKWKVKHTPWKWFCATAAWSNTFFRGVYSLSKLLILANFRTHLKAHFCCFRPKYWSGSGYGKRHLARCGKLDKLTLIAYSTATHH